MKDKHILKAFEVLAARIVDLENEANVSAFRMDKLKDMIARAEKEAESAPVKCEAPCREKRR